jgi:hypothetical protein
MRNPTFLAVVVAALVSCTGSGAQRPQSTEVRRDSPVPTSQPYEMKGTVESVGGGLLGIGESITIRRDNAPAVQLRVADQTRITLDDRPGKLSDLRPGDDVRAVFDFDRSNPVAIDIVAKKGSR